MADKRTGLKHMVLLMISGGCYTHP